MGMGTAPCSDYVISLDNLRALCPSEVAAIESTFDASDELANWGDYAREANNWVQDPPSIALLYAAFERETGGLQLRIEHYDEDSGDRYDEVDNTDGCVFCVDGMVCLTPQGEKFRSVIQPQSWTQFG